MKYHYYSLLKDHSENDASSKATTTEFSLATEDDYIRNPANGGQPVSYRMTISRYEEGSHVKGESASATTPTLNPNRPPENLTSEIFELICSQMKYIVGVAHKALIQNTMQSMITSSKATENLEKPDEYYESLWYLNGEGDDDDDRRRGRSPGRPLRASSLEPRKVTSNSSKIRQSSPQTLENGVDGSNAGNNDTDLFNDGIAAMTKKPSAFTERRSRSSSTGKRVSTVSGLTKSANTMSRDRLRSRGNETSRSEQSPLTASRASPTPSNRDEIILKQLETLRALPPDLYYRIAQHRLPIYGVWLTPSPLHLQPFLLEDMLGVVSETNLSDHKKLEWELDLMREYDEKKMDRIERFLISKRNPTLSQSSIKTKGIPLTNNNGKANFKNNLTSTFNTIFNSRGNSDPNYYKDRGRQPIHSIN